MLYYAFHGLGDLLDVGRFFSFGAEMVREVLEPLSLESIVKDDKPRNYLRFSLRWSKRLRNTWNHFREEWGYEAGGGVEWKWVVWRSHALTISCSIKC